VYLGLAFALCRRQLLFCIAQKSNQKSLVQKRAIAEHRSFPTCPSLTGSFASRIVMLDLSGSLSPAFSIAIFSHSILFCSCLAIDAVSSPPASGSLRQTLAAFGALHFTSFLFSIAVF